MLWAYQNCDNQTIINIENQHLIIKENDLKFKYWLDRYKYFDHYTEYSKDYYFQQASKFLTKIDNFLKDNTYIMGNKLQLVDLAIFPLIRQFANVDLSHFEKKFYNITHWYLNLNNSNRFKYIMKKYKFWSKGNDPLIINFNPTSPITKCKINI